MSCLFCQIIDRTIPSNIVHEDDQLIVCPDINPQAPHHYLVIPKKHIATLNDLQEEDQSLIGHCILTARQLAQEWDMADAGYRLVWNCNEHGGQSVYHIHLHLLGGRPMHWPPG